MYCRNCGSLLDQNADVCIKCGAAVGNGVYFCPNCGSPTDPVADVCIHCGVSLARYSTAGLRKSKVAAGILGIFLGCFGIHNFYLGYKGKAIAQLLLTILSCGILSFISAIWGLVEGILILVGSINCDANGIPLGD